MQYDTNTNEEASLEMKLDHLYKSKVYWLFNIYFF